MEAQNNPIFYSAHRQPPSPATSFNLNNHHQDYTNTKEHMFEKPLTPSDVGKLNRLVIPKQHAEKYFPLSGGGDAADQQKGFLLSFEDEFGKVWRFRYSYWNSSQSYVLTKGWSRYVKEKRLDPGDVVLFERHVMDCERMFIGWRRRSAVAPAVAQPVGGGGVQVSEWSAGVFYNTQSSYPAHHLPLSLPLPYQPDCLHAGGLYENVDNYRGTVSTRRLRLFGVNLDCPYDSEPSTSDGSNHGGQPDHHQYNLHSNNFHHNMMKYHQHEG